MSIIMGKIIPEVNDMVIIPIKDLKNTGKISKMVHESDSPVYVTKNGYADMVIMSSQSYENQQNMIIDLIKTSLEKSHEQSVNGETVDYLEALSQLKSKYGL